MEIIQYILAGAAVGFAIGVTGVGGGSLMTPLLLMFGYPPPVAVGTDLLYAAITKSGGALSHHRHGNVNWHIVALLALGSLPVSILLHFYLAASQIQEGEQFGELLTTSLGMMLIVTAIILIIRDKLRLRATSGESRRLMYWINQHRNRSTVLMGIVLGICVTLSSVGAGAFGAAVLLIIYSTTPAVKIIATDVAHAVPLTFVAGLGYLIAGYVDFILLGGLLIGSLPAIHLGTRVSNQVPELLLQRILIAILLALGLNYALL